MSLLPPFSPSQTKAICFPSGEKAGSPFDPEKVVSGTVLKVAARDLEGLRLISLYKPSDPIPRITTATDAMMAPILWRLISETMYSALEGCVNTAPAAIVAGVAAGPDMRLGNCAAFEVVFDSGGKVRSCSLWKSRCCFNLLRSISKSFAV